MSGLPEGWSDRLNQLGRPVRTPDRPAPEAGDPGVPGVPEVPRAPRRRWGRRIVVAIAVLLALLLILLVWMDTRLKRVDALADYSGRPAVTPGTDWLIVGSDSREGLDSARRKELATGEAAGQRTDTMMVLHIPRGVGGSPTLVSLPRDSYVPIPGHGSNKLNAAYAFGGPKLLARTVEGVTGIRIDHYMEIGFDGFANAVDAVGGVRICVDKPMRDPKAGLDIGAGCQVLNSREALGYVRTRASPRADLDRVERQRQFLGALVSKVTSLGVLLNPFRSIPLALHGTDSIAVNRSDHLNHLIRFPFAMRGVSSGDGVATTVPIARTEMVAGAGSVVRWDRQKALALFDALRQDRSVKNLVSG